MTAMIVLDASITAADIARALRYTGYAISNTLNPHVYVIRPSKRELPENCVEFQRPALLRRQGE